jgi:hypothetical protein
LRKFGVEWDVDASYQHTALDLVACDQVEVLVATENAVVVEARRSFGASGASRAIQRIRLRRGGRRDVADGRLELRPFEVRTLILRRRPSL